MFEIIQLPVLNDNYIYVIHEKISGDTAVVDPSVAQPVLNLLNNKGWKLKYILNTHHHSDHVSGNLELKLKTACKIIGSRNDSARIPGIDRIVDENDFITLGNYSATVIATPGHTNGHIAYYFSDDNALFCGDTLFVMGCGRLFEGTAGQMWQSLQKLKALPAATKVYCAHEYTQNNSRFALSIEPDNQILIKKSIKINQLNAENLPTVPSTIADELATNPFFRENSLSIQTSINRIRHKPVEVFAEIRRLKDRF